MSSSTEVSEWAAAQWGLHPNSLLNRDLEEVVVHPDDPAVLSPAAELWVQTDSTDIAKSVLKFRDPTTGGWSDLSSAGGEEHEVFIQDTDPLPTDPLAELWYTPKQAAPITPPALWDVAITYNAGDYCLWPDPDHWQANRITLGEEPGVPLPVPPISGLVFPGGSPTIIGGFSGVPAPAGFDATSGFDVRINTGGTLGAGDIVLSNSVFAIALTGGDFQVDINSVPEVSVPQTSFTHTRWLRVKVDASGAEFFSSADGSTWVSTGAPTPCALPTTPAGGFYLGNHGQSNTAYGGVLEAVQTFDATGTTPMQSWVRSTQPGALGAGVSPLTGENYPAPVNCSDSSGTALPEPWDMIAAPPTTSGGGILRANVAGVWEDVASGVSTPPVEEVVISPDDPLAAFPGVELWVDTDEDTPPPPNPDEVWIGNDPPTDPSVELWYDADAPADVGTLGDEVHVGPDDPDVAVPGSGIELWYDTTTDPGVLKAKVAGQWATTVADPELPLGGAVGQMLTKKTVTDGDVQWSNQPPSGLKAQDGLAITSGALYQITTMGSNGDHMFHLTATVRSGDSVQMFEVGAHAAIGGSGLAQIGLLGNWASGTKMFDRAGVHWEATGARLMLRAAWTGSLSIGWRLEDLLNANPNAGNATWTAFDPSGNEIAGVAL